MAPPIGRVPRVGRRSTLTLTLHASTWAAESHGLFDYESRNVFAKVFRCNCDEDSYHIVRTGTEVDLLSHDAATVLYENDPSAAHLATVSWQDGHLYLIPASFASRRTPPSPANSSRARAWLVIRTLRDRGAAITAGDVVKLGRYRLRVKEVVSGRRDEANKMSRLFNSSDDEGDDCETEAPGPPATTREIGRPPINDLSVEPSAYGDLTFQQPSSRAASFHTDEPHHHPSVRAQLQTNGAVSDRGTDPIEPLNSSRLSNQGSDGQEVLRADSPPDWTPPLTDLALLDPNDVGASPNSSNENICPICESESRALQAGGSGALTPPGLQMGGNLIPSQDCSSGNTPNNETAESLASDGITVRLPNTELEDGEPADAFGYRQVCADHQMSQLASVRPRLASRRSNSDTSTHHCDNVLTFSERRSEPSEEVRAGTTDVLGLHKAVPICRICLCGMDDEDFDRAHNPFVAPCDCKGSMKWVHLQCLRTWMAGRLNIKTDGTIVSFFWRSLECELCKVMYPSTVKIDESEVGSDHEVQCNSHHHKDVFLEKPVSKATYRRMSDTKASYNRTTDDAGEDLNGFLTGPTGPRRTTHTKKWKKSRSAQGARLVDLFEIPRLEPPYAVLEPKDAQHRGLHVVSLAHNKTAKLVSRGSYESSNVSALYPSYQGRGHESDIRLADISVSRLHAMLRYCSPPPRRNMSHTVAGAWGLNSVNSYPDGYFLLEDNRSKFGTLLEVRTPLKLDHNAAALSVQIGRTVLTFSVKKKWKFMVPACLRHPNTDITVVLSQPPPQPYVSAPPPTTAAVWNAPAAAAITAPQPEQVQQNNDEDVEPVPPLDNDSRNVRNE